MPGLWKAEFSFADEPLGRRKLIGVGVFSELLRTTELLVLHEQQLPTQRFFLVPGLVESTDVGGTVDQAGIPYRFADQKISTEFCLAASVFRQYRFDGDAARKSTHGWFFPPSRRGTRRVRFSRVSPDFERELTCEAWKVRESGGACYFFVLRASWDFSDKRIFGGTLKFTLVNFSNYFFLLEQLFLRLEVLSKVLAAWIFVISVEASWIRY